MMKRVSELITNEEINKWSDGDIITIKAGTGQGKSYFIKNKLYNYAKCKNKKILMLLHRTNCSNQFHEEIERDKKDDVIDIITYQHIETLKRYDKDFDFNDYEYIVCDEFHYFISDAAFNKYTDMSLNNILEQEDKIRIFMSATGDYMKNFLNEQKKRFTIDYELPIKFDFIKELYFYNKDYTLESKIEELIRDNQKGIFFIQSANKAYELYKKYKDYAFFNCSKNNKEYYQYVDTSKIDNMLKNEKFDDLILITTTCLDAGVNIVDSELNTILCDVKDIDVLVQCIGRKRVENENDKIILYIKNINNRQLGGMETQINKKYEMAKFALEHSVKEFIKEYPREYDKHCIVYDVIVNEDNRCTKKVNMLMYYKCLTDSTRISVIKTYRDSSFCEYLSEKFGVTKYTHVEESQEKQTLEEYLEGIIGVKLFNDEQQELSNLILKELITISSEGKIDYRTKKLKPTTLESIIRVQLGLPFAVSKVKLESKGDMRGKRYIIITKLN